MIYVRINVQMTEKSQSTSVLCKELGNSVLSLK